ncbi:hypothetical protein SETIT_3G389300v2 [Setaria italica]|uniref:Uncharacterized protein n=1 Tax=Setaria italica TaxID=4555 RepID=A0A368QNG6_SETIT|nr:hypothetical protein SETIT_3G389300v2 [Setaria italica]
MYVSNLFYPSTAEAEVAAAGEAKTNKTTSSASETGWTGNIEQMPEPIHGVHYKPFRPAFSISSYPGGGRAPEMFARLGEDKLLCSDVHVAVAVRRTTAHAMADFEIDPRVDADVFSENPGGDHADSLYVPPCGFDVLACYPVGSWRWRPLPPPPFVHDPGYRAPDDKAAVAVVSGGATICVSAAAATYAFDTVARAWSKAGDWVLPFHGEAAHVPVLGLWLGMSAGSSGSRHDVCAVDLAAAGMGSPAAVQHVGLDLVDPPKNWSLANQTLVNLGSGRFCVA